MDFAAEAVVDMGAPPTPRPAARSSDAAAAAGPSFDDHLEVATADEPTSTGDAAPDNKEEKADADAGAKAPEAAHPTAPHALQLDASLLLQLSAPAPATPAAPTTASKDALAPMQAPAPGAPPDVPAVPAPSAAPTAPSLPASRAEPEVANATGPAAPRACASDDAPKASAKGLEQAAVPSSKGGDVTAAQPAAPAPAPGVTPPPGATAALDVAAIAALAESAAPEAAPAPVAAATPTPTNAAPKQAQAAPAPRAVAPKQVQAAETLAPPPAPAAGKNATPRSEAKGDDAKSEPQTAKTQATPGAVVAKDGAALAAADAPRPTPSAMQMSAPSISSAHAALSQHATPDLAVARAAPAAAQVAREIVRHFNGETTRFELRVDPPELGRVEVRLEVSRDHRVTAAVAADSPQALTELARHARELEQSLQSAGLELADNGLSFDLRQSREDAREAGADAGAGAADPQDEAAEAPMVARPIGLERWRGVRVDVTV